MDPMPLHVYVTMIYPRGQINVSVPFRGLQFLLLFCFQKYNAVKCDVKQNP